MQRKLIVIVLLFFVFINSCKTDFSVIAPYKQVTVVYGLLDPNPTVQYQYIKINKAFLGEGNALLIAQQTDSINYKPGVLNVQLEQINSDNSVQYFPFEAIDTVPKNPGIFANPYQILYINKNPLPYLTDSATYKLIIYNNSDNLTLTSSTGVVQRIDSSFFTSPNQNPTAQIALAGAPTAQYQVQFQAAVNARLYSLQIMFHYGEKNISTGDSTAKTLSWSIGTQKSQFLNGQEKILFVFNRADFYGFLVSQLSPNNSVARYVSAAKQIDFVITYCGDDLSTYIDVNQPSIGIVQEVPEYSNITNGIGIFSSRSAITLTRTMNQASLDTLAIGSVTGSLNFIVP